MDQASTVAWYRNEIDHMRQAIDLMEGGLRTTSQVQESRHAEDRTARVLPQYKGLLVSLEAALARIEDVA